MPSDAPPPLTQRSSLGQSFFAGSERKTQPLLVLKSSSVRSQLDAWFNVHSFLGKRHLRTRRDVDELIHWDVQCSLYHLKFDTELYLQSLHPLINKRTISRTFNIGIKHPPGGPLACQSTIVKMSLMETQRSLRCCMPVFHQDIAPLGDPFLTPNFD